MHARMVSGFQQTHADAVRDHLVPVLHATCAVAVRWSSSVDEFREPAWFPSLCPVGVGLVRRELVGSLQLAPGRVGLARALGACNAVGWLHALVVTGCITGGQSLVFYYSPATAN